MKWDKTGDHRYKCWMGSRKLVLYRIQKLSIVNEEYKWMMECDGLCADVELEKVISSSRSLTINEAKKAALGLIVIMAEEEILDLEKLIKACQGK